MICLVNQGSQVRFTASPEIISVEHSGAPVIKYRTHTNNKPSRPSTGYYPGKSHKKFFKREKKEKEKHSYFSYIQFYIACLLP